MYSHKVGAHVSASGGAQNAVINAVKNGCNSFALFLKNQQRWESKPLNEEVIQCFKSLASKYNYPSHLILPHGSYLMNIGNSDTEKRKRSLDCLIDELTKCEQLNISMYNFHPGSTLGQCTVEECCKLISECINISHSRTQFVTVVVENMAGQGNVIGRSFEELAMIINNVEDKSRIGICLDTCHMFAAGYDIRTYDGYNKTIENFDQVVGLRYLKGLHLNDSKFPLGSNKDRHDNIGRGEIGLDAFGFIMNDKRLKDLPLILETPVGDNEGQIWSIEISLLNTLSVKGLENNGDRIDELMDELVKLTPKISKDNKSIKNYFNKKK